MAESSGIAVDTSSYPKPQASTSPLDVAGKLGTLQQQSNTIQRQGLDINQAKLDQANQALQYMTRAITSIGPNGTPEQYKNAAKDVARSFNIPNTMLQTWDDKVDNYAKTGNMKGFYDEALTAGANHGELINNYRGPIRADQNGNNIIYSQVPGSPNHSPIPRGSLSTQVPPTFGVTQDNPNLPNYGGTRNVGNLPPPQIEPPQNRLRSTMLQPLPTGPTDPSKIPGMRPGETATSAEVMPPTNPGSFTTGLPIGTEEGLKQRTADQQIATQKMTAVKPLMLAWPKILELERSGPGTQTWNDSVAFLKTWGIIPTQADNKDPTQIFQEVNKYMNQYVSRGGNRSDSEQAQREMSNPNVTKQILPALKNLTKNTVGQDRIEAARAGAFESRDVSRYGEHASQFPQTMHNEASSIDFLPENERKKKYNEMKEKAKNGNTEAIKFLKTLDTMRKQKIYELNN